MPDAAFCEPYRWGAATTPAEKEAVYAFRYAHYFNGLPEAAGVDSRKQRVYSPHDDVSTHITTHNAGGDLLVVGSGTPAHTPDLPEDWPGLLDLPRLEPLRLDKILIYSRLVEVRACRGSSLFLKFFQYTARYFVEKGYEHTIHYCPPALLSLYERLGYRMYAPGKMLPGGLFRVPLILVAADTAFLSKVNPSFLQATKGLTRSGDVARTLRALPGLAVWPLCARGPEERLAHVHSLFVPRPGHAKTAAHGISPLADPLLRRAAILSLQAGDTPTEPFRPCAGAAPSPANGVRRSSPDVAPHSPADDVVVPPQLWQVLSGVCRVTGHDGHEATALPGMFINGQACRRFTAETESDVLILGHCPAAGQDNAVLPASFWHTLTAVKKETAL